MLCVGVEADVRPLGMSWNRLRPGPFGESLLDQFVFERADDEFFGGLACPSAANVANAIARLQVATGAKRSCALRFGRLAITAMRASTDQCRSAQSSPVGDRCAAEAGAVIFQRRLASAAQGRYRRGTPRGNFVDMVGSRVKCLREWRCGRRCG